MKKLLLLLICVFSLQFVVADNDKVITITQLPKTAQQFIQKNFPNAQIAFAKMEKDWLEVTYDVIFVNGDKIEFNKSGEWKEIKCKTLNIPDNAIPVNITKFIKDKYTGAKIIQIEKDRYGYDVKLSNYWEIKFDSNYNVIDIDNDAD